MGFHSIDDVCFATSLIIMIRKHYIGKLDENDKVKIIIFLL